MTGAQTLKRIPRIKFPQRRPVPSGPASEQQASSSVTELKQEASSPAAATAVGGRASLQPRRTPVSDKEIESIMLGGCF